MGVAQQQPDPLAGLLDPNTEHLIAKRRAELHLRDFIPVVWNVLEPGREFVHGWAVDAIGEHLEAVTSGEIKRLVINVPPGCMKSLTTNVLWPAWEWGPKSMPTMRYVSASYSDALTIRDNRKCRNIIVSDIYQRYWGDRFKLASDQNAKMKFENLDTGFKIATSVGGLGTGERGDRFIIDDPHNIKDGESEAKRDAALQWFTEVVPTRINDADKSAIIVIMQRVHEQDVSGLILKEALNYEWLCLPMEYEKTHRSFTSVPRRDGTPPMKVTRVLEDGEPLPRWLTPEEVDQLEQLPVDFTPQWLELTPQDRREEDGDLLWPERFSEKYLEGELKPSLRSWGGSYAEAGQLQQRPAPRGGGMFPKHLWNFVDLLPKDGRWVRGWDLAGTKKKKSPWTVGVKMGMINGLIYIADVIKLQGTPAEVERLVLETTKRDGINVTQSFPQDPGQAGLAQKSAYAKMLHGWIFHFSTETGEKGDRAKPLAGQQEAGNVFVLRGNWNDAFINELAVFPAGQFKDQGDAASRAYDWLLRKRVDTVGASPQVLGG